MGNSDSDSGSNSGSNSGSKSPMVGSTSRVMLFSSQSTENPPAQTNKADALNSLRILLNSMESNGKFVIELI